MKFVYEGQVRPGLDHPNQEHWILIREKAIARDKRCKTCGNPDDLECHHVSYTNFGRENIDDVVMLCVFCHDAITSRLRSSRYLKMDLLGKVRKGMSDEGSKNAVYPSSSVDPAQRANDRPIESLLDGNETNISEAEKDRSRSFGNVPNRVVCRFVP